MAMNIALKLPGRLDFRQLDEWPKWKRRFVQYLSATGLDGASGHQSQHVALMSRRGGRRRAYLHENNGRGWYCLRYSR